MINRHRINSTYIYYAIIVSSLGYTCYYETQDIRFRLVSLFAVVVFYINSISILRYKVNSFRNYLGSKDLLYYIFLTIILLLFSISFNARDLVTLFTHIYAFPGFFIAIVALTVERNTLSKVLRMARVFNNSFILITVFDLFIFKRPVLLNEFSYFVLFEFLFFEKLNMRRRVYLAALVIFIILISNHFDYRSFVIRFLAIAFILLTFFTFKFLECKLYKYTILLFSIVVLYFITFQFEASFSFITGLLSTGTVDTTDTRSFIYLEFFEDFKGLDWLAGKGYLGTYFSQYFYDWDGLGGDSSTRFSVEVGILDILLKGGIVLLMPFLFIMLKALRNGFLNQSHSSLSFKLAIFILVDLVLMGIENFPSFSIHYMLFWLAIGYIYKEHDFNELSKKSNKKMVVFR